MSNQKISLFRQGAGNQGTDTHYSPQWVTSRLDEIFGGARYLDPCPGSRQLISASDSGLIADPYADGLRRDWSATAPFSYVNPPYSQMLEWIQKASLAADQGHVSLWFTKLDYRTRWYEELENVAHWIAPVKGYVRFEKEDYSLNNSATFQTCFAVFGTGGAAVDVREKVKECFGHRLARNF